MAHEDTAEKLMKFMQAAISAGVYDPTTEVFNPNALGAVTATSVTTTGEVQAATIESDGGIGFFGTEPPGSAAAVTGALSTVADAPAKAVLTSVIGALVATGQATNGTT